MDVTHIDGDVLEHRTPILAIPVAEAEGVPEGIVGRADERSGGVVARAWRDGEFRGRDDDTLLLYLSGDEPGPERVLLLGTGDPEGRSRETFRRAAGRAVRRAEGISLTRLTLHLPDEMLEGEAEPVAAAAEGGALAAWEYREERTDGGRKKPPRPLVDTMEVSAPGLPGVEAELRTGRALGEGANLARTLQNRPGNVATPSHLAAVAEELAREHGLECRVLGPDEIRAERMHALLSVAQGSDQEPRFIVLEHRGGKEGEAPLALVGKGLTFDSGGISIKPSQGMEDMKFDMSGGAAVLGAVRIVAELGLPANVVGVVPATENLPGGRALKPGDIIPTRAGKKVEVINTDAEGRLILADALAWASDLEPAAIVDCATLTGAAVVALGHHASPLLGNDEELVREVRDAGERTGERCWTLPLWDEYRNQLDSKYADIKNVGGRPAGTITAGRFLQEFVGEAKWAHIDIAGTAYGEAKVPYLRDGGFGRPARLLAEWVRARAG